MKEYKTVYIITNNGAWSDHCIYFVEVDDEIDKSDLEEAIRFKNMKALEKKDKHSDYYHKYEIVLIAKENTWYKGKPRKVWQFIDWWEFEENPRFSDRNRKRAFFERIAIKAQEYWRLKRAGQTSEIDLLLQDILYWANQYKYNYDTTDLLKLLNEEIAKQENFVEEEII